MQTFTREGRFEDLMVCIPIHSSLHVRRWLEVPARAGESEKASRVANKQDLPSCRSGGYDETA